MNSPMKLCAAVLLGSVIAAGCGDDKDDNAAPSAPPPGATPTAPQATGTDVGTGIGATIDATKADAQKASDRLKTDAANAANDPAVAQAQTQVQQVMTYIKENKLDLAETTLQQLEKNKASLPATIQPQVDQARQMLNAAKAKGGSGTAAPALPAAPAPAPAPAQ